MMAESEQDVMSCQYYTQSTTRNFFSIEITKVKKKKNPHIPIQRSAREVCYQNQVIHSKGSRGTDLPVGEGLS